MCFYLKFSPKHAANAKIYLRLSKFMKKNLLKEPAQQQVPKVPDLQMAGAGAWLRET